MSEKPLITRVLRPFQQFAAVESASGIVLLLCTVIALAWANSSSGTAYFTLWERPLGVGSLSKSIGHWINDGLMVVFFLLVGLEIKRELLVGELSSRAQAVLPIAAAIGGMIVPALIYFAFNAGHAGARGWGIPMATDIAFALGVLGLLGPRIPLGLRVFLAALAIVDDIGAVLVIAVFYTSALSVSGLVGAVAFLVVLMICNRRGVTAPTVYAVIGVGLWVAVLQSGIHATIAGVLLAMTVPAAVLPRMEHALNRPVAFVIMPLFAFANAGVRLSSDVLATLSWRVVLGIALGLVLGKVLGIFGASWIAVRSGRALLPTGVEWRRIFGVSWLGGIGFTMSLFIASLAFGSGALLDSAKVGILAGSVVAGGVGALRLGGSRSRVS
jgi:NhaA family Na+:H+ antiporter